MPTNAPVMSDPLIRGGISLTIARLALTIDAPKPAPTAAQLRGALASVRPDLDLLHQHGREGFIYRAPRVIYRVFRGTPTVVAVEEGVDAVFGLNLVGRSLRLGATQRQIIDLTLRVSRDRIGEREQPRTYTFLKPWLALNQTNHKQFNSLVPHERREFLNRQIVNNCLSLSKSYGFHVTQPLQAKTDLRPVTIRHKGISMLGFQGSFQVNFDIPDGLGLGKTISKGFGGVQGLENSKCNSS